MQQNVISDNNTCPTACRHCYYHVLLLPRVSSARHPWGWSPWSISQNHLFPWLTVSWARWKTPWIAETIMHSQNLRNIINLSNLLQFFISIYLVGAPWFFPFSLPYILQMLYWPTCVAWNVIVSVVWPDVVWMPVLSPTPPQWGTDPSRGRLMAQSCVDKAWSPSHHCHLTVIAAAAIKEIWSKHDKTCQKKQHNGWTYSKI